jgi:hypothetical protein
MAQTTATTTADLIISGWSAELHEAATEESVVTREFTRATSGKIHGAFYVRKIGAIGATSLATAAAMGRTSLTATANTEDAIAISPVNAYAAVQIDRQTFNRLDFDPKNPYGRMIKYGLAEYYDQYGAQLAASLSIAKGSGAADFDKGLLADALQSIATNAKRYFKIGVTPWYLKVHTSQIKNVVTTNDFTASYVRGDAEKPIKSGWVNTALGAQLDESGNVYQSGGITHNLAYIAETFAFAYNEEAIILPPQDDGLTVWVIGNIEFGMSEIEDTFGVDVQTRG